MCLTCGCNDAHRKMGNSVTYEDIPDVATENGRTVDQTLWVLTETAASDRAQPVEEYERAWDTGKV